MHPLFDAIRTATQLGAVQTLTMLGIHSGDMSFNQARRVYGSWFTEAVRQGRIQPVHIGNGSNGKHTYKIADILTLKVQDEAMAEIQTSKQ